MKLLEFLKGKKTYLVALAVAVVTFCEAMGWVTHATSEVLYGVLGAGGLAALRHGMSA